MRSLLPCCLAVLWLLAGSAHAERPIPDEAPSDPLLRLTPAAYGDDVSTPAGVGAPSARAISNAVCDEPAPTPKGHANGHGLTDMFWLWGQFVDHDLGLTPTADPAEPFDVPVPAGDPDFATPSLAFERSEWDRTTGTGIADPREQVNVITSLLDGSVVYGSDATRAAALRTNDGTGRLATSAGDLLPFNTGGLDNANEGPLPDSALFLAGDVRANENVALTAMHTVFVREHNRIAGELAQADPLLSGEELYEGARARVGALLQAITYDEFLPLLLGPDAIDPYAGYDASVDARIATEFSTAAYRFGHSLLGEVLARRNGDGSATAEGDLALASAFFAPGEITQHGIDSLLAGAAWQTAQEIDPRITDAVRSFLFGPPGAGGLDLASLNIQRGRDHGLGRYNEVRLALGMDAALDWDDISSDPTIQSALSSVYASVDDVDLWVGGLAEDAHAEGIVGELWSHILADQFTRTRDGDPFWYELVFSGAELAELQATTLSDVILRNTDLAWLPANVYLPEPPLAWLGLALVLASPRVRRRWRVR